VQIGPTCPDWFKHVQTCFLFISGEGEESQSDKVDTDDEGIEQDHDDFENRGPSPPHAPSECLRSTLGLCQSHLSVESEADDHFRNVCRALVSEAMELSFFLEKTYLAQNEADQSEELKLLARKDWVNIIKFFARMFVKNVDFYINRRLAGICSGSHSKTTWTRFCNARKVFNSFQTQLNHIQGCVGCQMKRKTSIKMILVVFCNVTSNLNKLLSGS